MQPSDLFQPVLVPRQKVQFAWQPHRRAEGQCRRLGIHHLPPLTLLGVTALLCMLGSLSGMLILSKYFASQEALVETIR